MSLKNINIKIIKKGLRWCYESSAALITNPNYYSISIKSTFHSYHFNPETELIYYCSEKLKNWGDSLNHVLIPLLSCKKVLFAGNIFPIHSWVNPIIYNTVESNNYPLYYVVGSILQWIETKNAVVWGSGYLHEDRTIPIEPKEIYAVRGPLSADKIADQFGYTTNIYGDPAALYSLYYKPKITKKYDLGIIPHYVDYKYFKKHYKKSDNIRIINIRSDTNELIDDVLSCKNIASSSLHGLIIAEAYHIPTVWMSWMSPSIDDFKYYDYYSSIRCDKEKMIVTKDTSPEDIISQAELPAHGIDMKKLLDACPFYDKEKSPIQIK